MLTLSMIPTPAFGAALSDAVVEQLKESGQLDARIEKMRALRSEGWNQPGELPVDNSLALGEKSATVHKVLVLLVDFEDKLYTEGYASATSGDFDSLLFSEGLNPTGSMREYYIENSYGNYFIEGTVAGWYTHPLSYTLYATYTGTFGASDLVRDVVQMADDDVDFSQFDNDGDGYVEGVIVVHSGTGYEESGQDDEIHSHMSYMNAVEVDGVYVNRYTIQPEESRQTQTMSAIGVFCHEWGHILGLPDLYDIDYSSRGVARWSLMGSGNYNGQSRLPAHMDAWCKSELGWLTLVNVIANTAGLPIPAVEHNPIAYRLNRNGVLGTEYFIVENRYATGFDIGLPGFGLLVYHIDMDQNSNADDWRPMVFVEQADGKFDLQYNRNSGDDGDTWPNSVKAREFHDRTIPDSRYYSGVSTQVALWNISDSDSVMTADAEVQFSRPWLEKVTVGFGDVAYGDGDGVLEAGEKIQVVLTLRNEWAAATGIEVTMTIDDPALTVVNGTRTFPDLAMGAVGNNETNPFEFQIPGEYNSRIDSFFFDVTADGDTYQISMAAEQSVGRPQILIVDDDNGDPDQIQNYVGWPLYFTRTPVEYWDINLSDLPPASTLIDHHIVIWITGDARPGLLSLPELLAIKDYLDAGGNLFLTGQALAGQLASQDADFLANYLRAEFISVDTAATTLPSPALTGTGGPISEDTIIVIDGGDMADNQTVQEHLVAVNGGVAEWKLLTSPNCAAVSYDGDYKLVFFDFGFEAIRDDDHRWETPQDVIAKVIDFFGEIPTDVEDRSNMAANLPHRFVLGQNAPNPFNPTTRISYVITGADGGRSDRTIIEVFNVIGQQVITLVDRIEGPGEYAVTWDGRDKLGREAASGLYFYRLSRGNQAETRKMMLLK